MHCMRRGSHPPYPPFAILKLRFSADPKGPKQESPGGGNPACGVGPGDPNENPPSPERAKSPGARQMVRAVLSVHDRSEPPSGPILGNRPKRAHPGHAPYPDARTIWRAPTRFAKLKG